MSVIDRFQQLVEDDRRFRKEAFDRARGVLQEIRRGLEGIVGALGNGEESYPTELNQDNPSHPVVLLGPRAVHVILQESVGVRKDLVYAGGDKVKELFHEIAAAPDHAHPDEHSVAIEFVRGSSEAFRLRAPSDALVFATLHVGSQTCVLESKLGPQAYPLDQAAAWLPEVLATLLGQSLALGISVWPGPRTIEYAAVLETRLLGMPTAGEKVRDKRIGFEPPRRDDDR